MYSRVRSKAIPRFLAPPKADEYIPLGVVRNMRVLSRPRSLILAGFLALCLARYFAAQTLHAGWRPYNPE